MVRLNTGTMGGMEGHIVTDAGRDGEQPRARPKGCLLLAQCELRACVNGSHAAREPVLPDRNGRNG